MSLATGPDRLGQLSRAPVADMCVVDVPVTSIVETIDTVARRRRAHRRDRHVQRARALLGFALTLSFPYQPVFTCFVGWLHDRRVPLIDAMGFAPPPSTARSRAH